MGSLTIGGTIVTALTLAKVLFRPSTLLLITLWSFSPLGSQAIPYRALVVLKNGHSECHTLRGPFDPFETLSSGLKWSSQRSFWPDLQFTSSYYTYINS